MRGQIEREVHMANASANLAKLKQKMRAIAAQIEAIHSLAFATFQIGDPDFSHERLSDEGALHELIHNTLAMLPAAHELALQEEDFI